MPSSSLFGPRSRGRPPGRLTGRPPGHRRGRSVRRAVLTAALGLGGLTTGAFAQEPQGPTVATPPRTLELGLDAGAVFGLGDVSSISLTLPAGRARVGLFLHNYARWSVEPAASLTFTDAEGADGVLLYNLEAGALYHFRAPGELGQFEERRGRSVAYVRPFVNFTGATGGGDSEISIGSGLGLKVPWRAQLAFRFEANVGYGFDNEAGRIGAFAGLSFFTRRGR